MHRPRHIAIGVGAAALALIILLFTIPFPAASELTLTGCLSTGVPVSKGCGPECMGIFLPDGGGTVRVEWAATPGSATPTVSLRANDNMVQAGTCPSTGTILSFNTSLRGAIQAALPAHTATQEFPPIEVDLTGAANANVLFNATVHYTRYSPLI
jgi:hypothetical protein